MKNSISTGTLTQRQCPEGTLHHLYLYAVCMQASDPSPAVCNWGRDGPPFPGPTPNLIVTN
jgi:hypothetical protein